jgi:hypothetical protein
MPVKQHFAIADHKRGRREVAGDFSHARARRRLSPTAVRRSRNMKLTMFSRIMPTSRVKDLTVNPTRPCDSVRRSGAEGKTMTTGRER